ncbi:MAG: EscU/YscU/HrcU family type III secretion system export apparatus switch protein [Acidobacteriota bacterium]
MSDQRTEKATPRRLQKARDKGQFLSSRLLIGGLQFTVATTFFSMFAGGWTIRVAQVLAELMRRAAKGQLHAQQLIDITRAIFIQIAFPLAVGGMALVGLALACQLFVTKLGISTEKLTPDLSKLNPLAKIKGMARENTMSFLQGLVLIPLLLFMVFWMFRDNLNMYMSLPRISAAKGSVLVVGQIQSLLWKASSAFLLFGLLDYVRERHRYAKSLRMTKQEIRDEVKDTEGSVEMKGKIKRLQRSHHRRRMLQEVKTATAVVVNPTHYAVALRYDPAAGGAPVVVAKGKNLIALRIRAIATEHYIPIVENPPLARGLYSAVEVGHEIPEHLYRAVAEILAHVFKLMNSYRAGNVRQ